MQLLIFRKAAIMHVWILFLIDTWREEVRRAAYAGMVSLNPPNHPASGLMIYPAPSAIFVAGVFHLL